MEKFYKKERLRSGAATAPSGFLPIGKSWRSAPVRTIGAVLTGSASLFLCLS